MGFVKEGYLLELQIWLKTRAPKGDEDNQFTVNGLAGDYGWQSVNASNDDGFSRYNVFRKSHREKDMTLGRLHRAITGFLMGNNFRIKSLRKYQMVGMWRWHILLTFLMVMDHSFNAVLSHWELEYSLQPLYLPGAYTVNDWYRSMEQLKPFPRVINCPTITYSRNLSI